MHLTRCEINNFGSYKELQFDYSNFGLALVYGATGSGKSTLMDVAPWILYGTTAKGGAVDDVKSWQGEGATYGRLEVEVKDRKIAVVRIRGKAGQNDLYWEENGEIFRGKDIPDTQSLLIQLLGVSERLFLLSAYFHEFSAPASFFTDKAEDRRALLSEIADTTFATSLYLKAAEEQKALKPKLVKMEQEVSKLQGKVEQSIDFYNKLEKSHDTWKTANEREIQEFKARAANFDKEIKSKLEVLNTKQSTHVNNRNVEINALKEELAEIERDLAEAFYLEEKFASVLEQIKEARREKCPHCKNPTGAKKIEGLIKLRYKLEEEKEQVVNKQAAKASLLREITELEIERDKDIYAPEREELKNRENLYLQRVTTLEAAENPYDEDIKNVAKELEELSDKCQAAEASLIKTRERYNGLLTIKDLTKEMRGLLLAAAVKDVETKANQVLEDYFDSELKLQFAIDTDKLHVFIQKSGFSCNYAQLSKGQRQLLKLSFAVAVMDLAANNAGVHFDTIMLDEALDGLDGDLKVKAYRLFEALNKEHTNVIVIDHSPDLQNMFDKRYQVNLVNDYSEINEQ